MRRGVVMAAVGLAGSVGCKSQRATVDAVVDAAPPSRSAPPATVDGAASAAIPAPAPASTPAADEPLYRSFRGRSFYFGTERRGDAVRALYYAAAPPVALRGSATDATHFSVRQVHVRRGEPAISIAGEWSADGLTLTATLTDPRARHATRLSANEGPFPDHAQTEFKSELQGSLGGRFVRIRLERAGATLRGRYRYTKSPEDLSLAGSVAAPGGTFDVTETVRGKVTGRFSGAFVSESAILATWSSADGSRSLPVELIPGDGYPETVALGSGLSMYPQETLFEGAHCKTDIVYPQVRGAADEVKEAQLNQALRRGQRDVASCEGPGQDDSPGADFQESYGYSLLTAKPGRFARLSRGGWSYTGGEHGLGGSVCTVIDTKTLTELRMVDSLTKEGRDALGDKVTRALRGGGPRLTEQLYFSDQIEIGRDTNVCLTDAEIRVELMAYEVAPYSWAHLARRSPGPTCGRCSTRAR